MLTILRIILILLVVRALWYLLRGVLEGAGYRRVDGPRQPAVKLVRDPVCGVFVAPTTALTAHASGETVYFCSERCREQWKRR